MIPLVVASERGTAQTGLTTVGVVGLAFKAVRLKLERSWESRPERVRAP